MKRPIGLLLNWNTHAAILGMLILPWILRYALSLKVTNAQICVISIASFLSAFAMGLTQSRGALLILATGFILLIVIIRRQQQLSYKSGLFFLLAIILGYLLSSFFVNESLLQRISTITEVQTYTATGSGRHLLWPAAWHMYLDRPFLGWGLESFAALFAQYKFPLHAEYGYYAHNDYLQFLVELGPIGLILFLAFVFFIGQKLFYVLKQNKDVLTEYKIEAFALLATCVGMLIHTFFTFHLYQLSIQVILGYYLGGAAKYVHLAQVSQPEKIELEDNIHFKRYYRMAWFVMVVLVIMTGVSTYHISKAEKSADYQEKIDYFLTAGLFFPALDKHDSLSARYYTDILRSMPQTSDNVDERKQIALYALQAVDRAIEKMPLQKWNYITKAELLSSVPENYSEARQQYVKALQIDPYLLKERLHYAQFLEEKGQHDEALKVMWAGWGLLIKDLYQTGLNFLQFQLEMNKKYGQVKDNTIIELQIQQLKELTKLRPGGKYALLK